MTYKLDLPPRQRSPSRPQISLNIKSTSTKPILSPVSMNNTKSIKQPILPNSTLSTDKIIPIFLPS